MDYSAYAKCQTSNLPYGNFRVRKRMLSPPECCK